MACGDIDWWRAPDLEALIERHGVAEHLVVQVDFMSQVWRMPRAEFSIPNASKNGSGSTGYADVVSIDTREIWEIKPKHLADKAAEEAQHYVKYALANCGLPWVAGTSYTASRRLGGGGVVFRLEGMGNKAELVALQGAPGVIYYEWQINGKARHLKEVPDLSWAILGKIVADYFTAGQPPQPLQGAKPPYNLPPPKFKPPVLFPGECIPQLNKFIPLLLKSLETTCQPRLLENSKVAILIEERFFDALVGVGLVANAIANMQVTKSDPVVKLYREALAVLTATVAIPGVIGVILGLVLGAIELVGAVFVMGAQAAATAVGGTASGALAAAFRTALATRNAVAAGASFVAFAIPRAAGASSGKHPPLFDVSVAQFLVLAPGMPAPAIGRGFEVDGARWRLVGLAHT